MPIDGVVTQTTNGQVLQCSNALRCFLENGSIAKGQERACLLSVNHGDRCSAWGTDVTKWLIDADVSKVRQLP